MSNIPPMEAHNPDLSLEGFETDDDVQVLDIGMFEGGAEGGGFHMKNNPKDPYQRQTMIERQGDVDIRVSLVDVIHGDLSTDDPDSWATLLVILVRFDPQKKARRIVEATIELTFDAQSPAYYTPEVVDISFNGHYSFMPGEHTETLTRSFTGGIGASFGADAKADASWEKTTERQKTGATTITGGIRTAGGVEPKRVARWTIIENQNEETGVPASVRLAVLIKRLDQQTFTCMPKLTSKADKWGSVKKVFSRLPKDDHVLLKPEGTKPTNKLMLYDTLNLAKTSLEKLGDVTFTTMITDALKTHQNISEAVSKADPVTEHLANNKQELATASVAAEEPAQPITTEHVLTESAAAAPVSAPQVPAQSLPTSPTPKQDGIHASPSSTPQPEWKDYIDERLQAMEKKYNDKLAEVQSACSDKLSAKSEASRQVFHDDVAVQMTALADHFDQSIAHLQAIVDQIRQTWGNK